MKMGTSRGKGMGPSTLVWQGGPYQPADLQPAPDSTGCPPSMGAGLREKKSPTDRKNMGVTVAAPLSAACLPKRDLCQSGQMSCDFWLVGGGG